MFFAAKSGSLKIVQRLLHSGARVDIRDKVQDLIVSTSMKMVHMTVLPVGGLHLEWSDS